MKLFDNPLSRFSDRLLAPFGADTRQVATFGVVGVSGTIVHFTVALTAEIAMHILIANCFGYLAAAMVSYFGHQRFTFRVPTATARHTHRLPRYFIASLSALAASETVLYVTHSVLGMVSWAALACAVATVPCITFIAYKFWVFAELPEPAPAPERIDV